MARQMMSFYASQIKVTTGAVRRWHARVLAQARQLDTVTELEAGCTARVIDLIPPTPTFRLYRNRKRGTE